MKTSHIVLIVIAVGILGVTTFFVIRDKKMSSSVQNSTSTDAMAAREIAVENYLKLNISNLSPQKETLGGKFMVTNVEVYEGSGVVSYEDGHNDYVADFTYTLDDNTGAIMITSFEIRTGMTKG